MISLAGAAEKAAKKPPAKPAKPAVKPQPVPNKAALANARKQWKSILDEADVDLPVLQRRALAENVFGYSKDASLDSASRYVLLQAAADAATASGYIDLFRQIDARLETHYQSDWLAWRVEKLQQIGPPVQWPSRLGRVLDACWETIDQADRARRFDLAQGLLDTVTTWARERNLPELTALAERRNQALQASKAASKDFFAAEKTLQTNPEDAEANLAVARGLMLEKGRWADAMNHLARCGRPERVALAKLENKASLSPAELVTLAEGWQELTPRVSPVLREVILNHVIALYNQARPKLDKPAQAKLNENKARALVGLAALHANDFSQWRIVKAHATRTSQGRFRVRGPGSIVFKHKLPRNFYIAFTINQLDGMRPRLHLGGTGAYIGNEGFSRNYLPHRAKTYRGDKYAYDNGKPVRLAIERIGQNFRWYADGNMIGQGMLKKNPLLTTLNFSAGDSWSPGLTEFWDFEVRESRDAPAPSETPSPFAPRS